MVYLSIVVVVLIVVALLRYPTFKRRQLDRRAVVRSARPPGTADLDDVDAIRPDIDASSMASARKSVSRDVPDGVLADALLDATPEQIQHLFAAVPQEIIAAAVGKSKDNVQQAPLKAEDLAQLRGVGDSVDDLEIWSFGEKS
ncbi:hypothetical protein FNU79_04785 [Deinococcus detaillensis]|uniref:Uncharacterized protein n=1 Tax=Deinococcus detaillensis TaxID=2592048 RepID=A0A553V3Y5_9DEIO|nr:hypothetical protein [Deinococcus detaillensis]TSA87210.1 hypothetical protein FNU79_04785 [Deinococcus detaillensis]